MRIVTDYCRHGEIFLADNTSQPWGYKYTPHVFSFDGSGFVYFL